MPKLAPVSSATPLWFTEGGAGLAASYPGQDWFNMVQAELLGILTAGEVKPEKGKLNQLAEAIKKIVGSAGFQPSGDYATTTALSNGLSLKFDKELVVSTTGSSETKVINQKGVSEALDKKMNTTALVQSTGTNMYSVMSQKSVSEALDLKVNYSAIVQIKGQNQYSVMSQRAVTNLMFGVDQIWKNMLSERVSGTTYTNSTGKPISVSITQLGGQDITMVIEVGGVVISRPSSTGTSRCFITFTVPDGSTYKVTSTGSEIINWAELR
ncbi:hypothetical protein [Providencia sp. PROV190]|uniref:hypothetical protein n=1 Tax=Providencia sp. PROV190 TaxID=2949891 RepID=UPI00234A8B8B|nr:hypothetical protein [Providencia sp. PROV190]